MLGFTSFDWCCCSVAKLSLTLCDPMNWSMPDFPVLYHFSEFAQLMFIESVMPSNHLILCHPLLLPSIIPQIRIFQMSQFVEAGSQSIEVSASTSVLPMNIQDWFHPGWTGWISLLSKGLSKVFSNTTVQKYQFLALSFLYSSTHIHTWPLEKPKLWVDGPLLAK